MTVIERIVPQAPFDFEKMLERPRSRPSKLLVISSESKSHGDSDVASPRTSVTRALSLPSRALPVRIVNRGTLEQPALDVHLPDSLTDVQRLQALKLVRHMFSVDTVLTGLGTSFSHDPPIQDLLNRNAGLRPILDPDLFEAMVKVVVGQQVNVRFAATLVERMVDLGSKRVEWNASVLPVFPSAEQVASWSYESLRALSFSQSKAQYVIDFARSIVDGQIELDGLNDLDDAEIIERLTSLRGIGRWTAECFMLFGMGRRDVIPAADIGVQNALQVVYERASRPKEVEVRAMAQGWRPWRSYITYYLWQSLI